MKTPLAIWATTLLTLAVCSQPLHAGDKDKVHEVGAGLKLTGELGKVSAITYKVKLEAGKTYVIDMISPDQKARDPFLRLLDVKGRQLAEDDDGGEMSAMIFQGQHRYVEAERLYRSALSLREKVGAGEATMTDSFVKLGILAAAQGRDIEAELYFKRVMSITGKSKTPDFREVIYGLLPLAIIYQHQGRVGEAELLAKRAQARRVVRSRVNAE